MKSAPALTARAEAILVTPGGGEEKLRRSLMAEHRLTVTVDGEPFAATVCTRNELRQMVLGRLCTAGRIESAADVASLRFSENEDRAEVTLRPAAVRSKSQAKEDRSAWRSGDIFRLAAYLRDNIPLHNETQGTHGCLLMHRGEILCCCEDMGRSSALDKAVGEALLQGLPLNECVLYTTGRVSAEIAQKAFTAGARVLASRTLPTLEAVALAKKRGLTLLGRAWEEQYEVYAQAETAGEAQKH